ncbi:MAG: LCP family protein, partial [Sarcina sp.]
MRSSRSERNKKKSGFLKNKVLLGALIAIIGVMAVAGGYVIGLINKMDRVDIDKESLGANAELSDKYSHVKNIALFGVDEEEGGGGRTDSIMVATIDTKTKKLKLTSFMRDSYVEIDGRGGDKLNAAYSYGKEELAMKTLNKNFDLNLTEFVSVNFSSLPKVIDKIGGVQIDVLPNELAETNKYITDNNQRLNKNSQQLSSAGKQKLDGVQALAYSRIRYLKGDDFGRTERQRKVLNSVLEKVLSMSVTSYPGLLSEIFPMVKTNLTMGEIMDMGKDVVSIGNNLEQNRFPMDADLDFETIRGMSCITFNKEVTKQKVHAWL